MTKYYIELNQYSNDADISLISNEVLKEVLEDFYNELNKRKEAINYTHCCETLIAKERISFEDYLQKFYIENGLTYQSKRTGKIVDIDEPKKRYDWYCKYN